VFVRRALRNALLPQVTALRMSLGQIVSGGVLVEQVRAIRVLTASIGNSDCNLLDGVVFLIIVGVSLATPILDLVYALLDPRIRTRQA